MKVECKVVGYHPATGLDLVVGEMEVTEDHAAQLEAAGLLVVGFQAGKAARAAARPEKKREEG